MSTDQTQWWWIRHAPVPDGGRIYGQSDLDCDCTDTIVFAALANELPSDAVWVTSSLKRARQTAAAIRASIGGEPSTGEPIAIPEFAEQHLGEWQGRDRKEFLANRPRPHHHFWFAPAHQRAPGGESFDDLAERVQPAIERLTARFRGRNIVAVTHGGTIKAALALALRIDPEASLAFLVENCSITRIDHAVGDLGPYWRVGAVNHRPWGQNNGGVPA